MIKLSDLKDDTLLVTEYESVLEAREVKENYRYYTGDKLYIANPRQGKFDAKSTVSAMIDCVYENEAMHEDWNEQILAIFQEDDYQKIQTVFDQVLKRAGSSNVTYDFGEPVEIDL